MSFFDTVGPPVFLFLLGVAVIIAVLYVIWWLHPNLETKKLAVLKSAKEYKEIVAYNEAAHEFITAVICEKPVLSQQLEDQLWSLQGIKKGIK